MTELETLLRCVDDLLAEPKLSAVWRGGSDSGQTCTLSNYNLIRLRDARARHLRSTGVPSRLDIASRSVSDDKPIAVGCVAALTGTSYLSPGPVTALLTGAMAAESDAR